MEDIKNKIAVANEKLDEIEKILENINSINKISDTDFENKLYAFITLCKSRINNQYAILVSPSTIQSIINNLNKICGELRGYNVAQNNNDAGKQNTTIANINSCISNDILSFINAVPFVEKGDNTKVINNLVNKLEKNSTKIIDGLDKNIKNCQNKADEVERKVDTINKEISNLSSRFQTQFASSQEDRLTKFNAQLERFESKIKEHNEEYEKLLEDNKNNYIQLTNNSKEKIKKIEEEINKIYGIVADKSLVGSQAKYADQSKNFANWLFGIAFSLMIIGAGIIVIPIFWALYNNPSAIDWKLILYKIPISFTILIPAFYAANESKKQRDRENLYRELEIKMCAIKPYFNDIGDGVCEQNSIPEKDKIKLKLAEKLLSPKELKNDDNIVIPKEVVDIIKEVLKVCPTSKK